jgi:zinc/manganese transport system ATP-binding protein
MGARLMVAVALQDLTLGYERRPAVHHLTGRFEPGKLHAVVGPNGSGKSTLLKGVAGLLRPLSGRLDLGGLRAPDIAYLPQESSVERGFPITVGELAALGLWGRRGLFGAIGKHDLHRVEHALEAVGLAGFEARGADQISGGQLQRALFARVLVQDAKVILLDEPFSALDERTAADLVELIQRWPGEGRTVIMVLHDLDLVRRLCAEALLLAREAVSWGPTAQALSAENLQQARLLSEAWAQDAHVCHVGEAA